MSATDDFTRMIDTSNRFFTELSANNSRDWFEPRKALYIDEIKEPALRFADLVAQDLEAATRTIHTAKLFRIYRDVRFSKDKTPYNAHLHMIWSPSGTMGAAPMWFFGSDPKGIVFMMGYPTFKGDDLARYRDIIDRIGAQITLSAQDAGASLTSWGPAPLKRVPKPYDADHPNGDLLRRKGLVLKVELHDGWRASDGGLPGVCREITQRLMPAYRLLEEGMQTGR